MPWIGIFGFVCLCVLGCVVIFNYIEGARYLPKWDRKEWGTAFAHMIATVLIGGLVAPVILAFIVCLIGAICLTVPAFIILTFQPDMLASMPPWLSAPIPISPLFLWGLFFFGMVLAYVIRRDDYR